MHVNAEVETIRAMSPRPRRVGSDAPFVIGLCILGGVYVVLIVAMVVADAAFTSPGHLWAALKTPEIRYSIKLSLLTCGISAILCTWVAVPLGYVMSRWDDGPIQRWIERRLVAPMRRVPVAGRAAGAARALNPKLLLDAIVDIPIVLPPLVVGLSLLILFKTPIGMAIERRFPVTYFIPSVIIAQFAVACAFAVRTMRVTFDQISPRSEEVALTLGCTRGQAFWMVVLPEAWRGILTAANLAWARSLGEFGPILVFAGATRMRTEVLSTTVFLELSVGNVEAAIAVSLLMILAAVSVLIIVRLFGSERTFIKAV